MENIGKELQSEKFSKKKMKTKKKSIGKFPFFLCLGKEEIRNVKYTTCVSYFVYISVLYIFELFYRIFDMCLKQCARSKKKKMLVGWLDR